MHMIRSERWIVDIAMCALVLQEADFDILCIPNGRNSPMIHFALSMITARIAALHRLKGIGMCEKVGWDQAGY